MASKEPTVISGSEPCSMRADEGFCPCPLNDAMDVLGSKWTLAIVVTVGNFGTLRFHELEDRLPGLGAKTLTRRLKELERRGLLRRRAYAEVPPRVEYSLTEEGERLRDAAIPLMRWAAAYRH